MSEAVARMLALEPGDRLPTAAAFIEALESAPGTPALRLPWLGDRAGLSALVAAARAGQRLDLVGGPGSGRSTLLREAAAVLSGEGRTVAWALRGNTPFESLSGVVGPGEALAAAGDVPARVREHLAAWLAQGGVLLVDDGDDLDRWSRGLLEVAEGAVLTAVAAPREGRPAQVLLPLTEAELVPLFHGPERILHLPGDGAHEL